MSKTTRKPTDFETRVYDMLGEIPRGKIVTYAELARALDCGSAQAVGQALKRNPYAPGVPCHRVIRTNLTIGGYSGATDGAKIRKKLRLLREEGVEFDRDGKLLSHEAVYQLT